MFTDPKFTNELASASRILSTEDLNSALDRLAAELTAKLQDANPIILGVMVGALVPLGHLLTRLHFPLEVDYVHATRYRGQLNGGELQWLAKPHLNLENRVVLIFDDIMDGGVTIGAIRDFCRDSKAQKVYSAVMINKIRPRAVGVNFEPDFIGISTVDRFLFGFGLDYHGCWRSLPAIYAL